ncbi:hypothetical protein [Fibrivirga algicola]|uniref:Uncharacterized protein n=1 Tax=Fibrivirga algicola TaxID=2950420 RepID=A0ABX0QAT4_9BACT|nr:hypothetical protein [Fibrivirga algicola]NID09380.1 hypothetical protein [Fibrivirga algicola]
MIRYELNGVGIDPPVGVDSLTLTKSRHRQYWGFFHRNLGIVAGLGSLRFTDPTAVRILAAGFGQINPTTTFAIRGDGLDYEAAIDYDSYSRIGEGIAVGLIDNSVADLIAARSATKYELPLDQSSSLSGRSIGDPLTLELTPTVSLRTVVQRSTGSGLPFAGLADPSMPVTVWANATAEPVTVLMQGRIQASVTVGSVSSYTLATNGTTLLQVTPSAGVITGLINKAVTVAANSSLVLTVTTGGTQTIAYDGATYLTLTQLPPTTSSQVYGIRLDTAVRVLLDAMGLTDLALSSDWLDTYGSGMLSTATGLAGKSATISLSLADLLGNLTTLHYLKTGLTAGGALSIESRAGSELPQVPFAYDQIASLAIKRATDFVFGAVTAGYDVPGDTAQRLTDSFRKRTYPTVATLSKNELVLKPTWVTDPDRIEQARRGQLSANADKTGEVFYLTVDNDFLDAECLYYQWAEWWDYDTLPELHTLQIRTDQPTYLNLGEEIGYDGPDSLTTYGLLLDAQYNLLDSMLTVSLLVR